MAQFLTKFDNVSLGSMKSSNNNPISNTIRINGVLLPPTPTPTVISTCTSFNVEIFQTDLNYATGNTDPSLNGVVFVAYNDCTNTSQDMSFYSAGVFINAICSNSEDLGYFQYWFNDNSYNESYGGFTPNGTCSLPIPTPTMTPTKTVTPTRTPTLTPTNSLTPSKTPTQTPTKTTTKTPTPTRTQTPTPSSNPILSTCVILFNDNTNKVYSYDPFTTSLTLLKVPNFPYNSSDIAHTSTKLWGVSGSSFVEYTITLPSFTATFSRNIPFPVGYSSSAGLAAISNTVILAVNQYGGLQNVVEINVSGGTAIMTTKFSAFIDRQIPNTLSTQITGDFIKTTDNKFLALNSVFVDDGNFGVITYCYLSQWDYLTSVLELDIPLYIGCTNYGLYEYNSEIFITATNLLTLTTSIYQVIKTSPYLVLYANQTPFYIAGASQVPSCLTASLDAPSPYLCSLNDVVIGSQTWTSCNLNVATYRDGTVIPHVTDPSIWSGLTTGAWCYYNNVNTTGNTYGMLYNWYAVAGIDGSATPRVLAPVGYRVATDDDWTTLTTFLGGESVSGGKLKETGTTHWNSPNTGAVNTYGFTALPGGYRNLNGVFTSIRGNGYWWASSSFDTVSSWSRQISSGSQSVTRLPANKTIGFSVRLIKECIDSGVLGYSFSSAVC